MSIWTHVSGCIRVDAFRMQMPHPCSFAGALGLVDPIAADKKLCKKIEDAMGHIVRFGDKDWATTLPLGSEGSLEYKIIENPDRAMLAAYVVPFWGDLRDFDASDLPTLQDWFKGACKKLATVRGAVLFAEVETGERMTLAWPEGGEG